MTALQYACGYSLDLYCDSGKDHNFEPFPKTFCGETFGECASEARKCGWIIKKKTRMATCPRRSGKKIER